MILGGFLLFIGQSFPLGGFSSNVWISLVFLMKRYDGMSKSMKISMIFAFGWCMDWAY